MSQPQTIDIAPVGWPPLTLTVVEDYRVRFYTTAFSDESDGSGWAQAPDGRYWRLQVPPAVYHALTVGDACGVLWHAEACLGAIDWDAREQEPNATAYQVEALVAGVHIKAYAGDVTCSRDSKRALLGRVDVDPGEEWWLVVLD